MVRFEESTGQLASTDRGRTASLYYINYSTANLVREVLHPLMLIQDLLSLIAQAKEFAQMKVCSYIPLMMRHYVRIKFCSINSYVSVLVKRAPLNAFSDPRHSWT